MPGLALRQSSYVVVTDSCPIGISTESADYVEINCGQSREEHFEFVLQREALRTIVRLGTEALERMDSAAATAANTQ